MGKVFLLYGDGDYKLIGDDVISFVFWFFIIVYIGDGLEDGFNYVVVSYYYYFNFFLIVLLI